MKLISKCLLLVFENMSLTTPSLYISGWRTTWRPGCHTDTDGEASPKPDDRRSVVVILPCGDATHPTACCHGVAAHQGQRSDFYCFLRCPQGRRLCHMFFYLIMWQHVAACCIYFICIKKSHVWMCVCLSALSCPSGCEAVRISRRQ